LLELGLEEVGNALLRSDGATSTFDIVGDMVHFAGTMGGLFKVYL
jgi:hypothetical protein